MAVILSTTESPRVLLIGPVDLAQPWMEPLSGGSPELVPTSKTSVKAALAEMEKLQFSLVLIFEETNKKTSEDFLGFISRNSYVDQDIPVIVSMVAHDSNRVAALLKLGAYDCILQEVDEGQKQHALNIFRQTVEEYQTKLENAQLSALNQVILDTAGEGILGTNSAGEIIFANPSAERLLQAEPGELKGRDVNKLIIYGDGDEEWQKTPLVNAYLHGHHYREDKDKFKTLKGGSFDAAYTVTILRDSRERLSGAVFVFSDITERKKSEARLTFYSHHDPLTGLKNRLYFQDKVSYVIDQAKRLESNLAVMFLDLDRFKWINDTMGHDAGDALLVEMAHRVKRAVRSSDVLARLGGDEFAILVSGYKTPEDLSILAKKILSTLEKPFSLKQNEVNVTGSVGIATYPDCGSNVVSLLKAADVAMYRAKHGGRNNYHFYSKNMHEQVQRTAEIQTTLSKAMDNGELLLYYQPQFDTKSELLIGVESLLRWNHPKMGLLSPLEFIGIAEESGLINPIGDWVLRTACQQADSWLKKGLIRPTEFSLAVNVSIKQLRNDTLCNTVETLLAELDVDPSLLEIEITEHAMVEDIERSVETLKSLHSLGLRVSVDDFGTGYSSLQYLQIFPIQTLKIDRCFIDRIPFDENNCTIVKATIALAKALKLNVVAEGVETAEQLEFLKGVDCDIVQGYYLGRPMPAEKIEVLLRDHLLKKVNATGSQQ
ncbi:MAG: EAL domain-containing protein [Pseudomonadales bacterium]|nr:EAL domain-containing protein [Pseudomonadales bacterium]